MSAAPVTPQTRALTRPRRIFTAETTEGTINFHTWIGDG
jgi:hypothetical protein